MVYYFFISILVLCVVFLISKHWQNKKYLVAVNVAICLVYIIWRFFTIPNYGIWNIIFGWMLFAAEILGLLQFFNMQVIFSKKYVLEKKTLSEYEELPSLDVFICTYNEPANVLEKTILAAKNLEYDNKKLNIFVCDDGKRKNIEELSYFLKVKYISRDNNEGAKAGNLNNALLHTKGELFAVLDADMICTKKFLSHTVGYFTDDNVAFVQTPQVYYNRDMYQHNMRKDNIPNEQDFFMRDIQQGRAAYNAVLHVGTNAVFRRSHVMEIGMYPTSSITEDMAVGMLLQSKGYSSIFVNEVLALGMSTTNYSDLAVQRDRWCRGNIQVIRHFNPVFIRGLNSTQRLLYFDGLLYWLSAFQKLIYVLCPVLFLFTGVKAINSPIETTVCIFLPYFIGLLMVYRAVAPNSRRLKWSHIYEIAMFPNICLSIIKEIFNLKSKFIVTPKDKRSDKSYFQTNVIIPHLIFAIFTVLAWAVAIIKMYYGVISTGAFAINVFWSIYNFIAIAICIRVAYQLADTYDYENAAVPGDIDISWFFLNTKDGRIYSGKITDISLKGAIIDTQNYVSGRGEEINICFEHGICLNGVIKEVKEFSNHSNVIINFRSLCVEDKMKVTMLYTDNLKPVFNNR